MAGTGRARPTGYRERPLPRRAAGDSWPTGSALPDLTFVLRFVAVFVALQVAYYAIPERVLHEVVIHHGTVRVSAGLINVVAPEEAVSALGNRIASGHAALDVIRGCDGSGSLFLLIAAVVAFRTDRRRKLVGLAAALLLMLALNQVRIVGLYFIVAWQRAWFDHAHTVLAPTLVVAVAALFFVAWTRWATGSVTGPNGETRAG